MENEKSSSNCCVYVLDMEGSPLMPTKRFGKVRRMLKDGRAKVVSRKPFTIQLCYEPATHVCQKVVLGIDPGRTNIGLCAVREDGEPLFAGELRTRNKEIPKLMEKRKMHRHASRAGERKVRKRRARANGTTTQKWNPRFLPGCEKPVPVKDIKNTEARFIHRTRCKGWLTPTAEQLRRTHEQAVKIVRDLLPITEVSIELNRFAFMKLDDPAIKGMAYQMGPMHKFKDAGEALETIQGGRCLLCGAKIEEKHHIVPTSRGGMDTLENLAGLCKACHSKVHKNVQTAKVLGTLKKGTRKKHAGASVLNQIMPSLLEHLDKAFSAKVTVTEGWQTKAFRDDNGILKGHASDAYCIACQALCRQTVFRAPETVYSMKQYRRHDRALIQAEIPRIYKLDGKTVAKNRKKAAEQADDSLEEWYAKMVSEHGEKEARQMRSRLKVLPSRRRMNNPERVMPGAVFLYRENRYVLRGQQNSGRYYLAEGEGDRRFPAEDCRIVRQNTGIVFL